MTFPVPFRMLLCVLALVALLCVFTSTDKQTISTSMDQVFGQMVTLFYVFTSRDKQIISTSTDKDT